MSTQFHNVKDAAKLIGISRQALYAYYLQRYQPIMIAGHPVLSSDQIRLIRAERRQRKNGKLKQAA